MVCIFTMQGFSGSKDTDLMEYNGHIVINLEETI